MTLLGCSQGNTGSGGVVPPSPLVDKRIPATISAMGTVPLLEGNSSTTVMFVHNTTSDPINGITYSINTNLNTFQQVKNKLLTMFGLDVSSSDVTLDRTTAQGCANIPAYGVCRIAFTTPAVESGLNISGSNVVTMAYPYKGKNYIFNQLIAYQAVNNNIQPGAYSLGARPMAWNNHDVGSNTTYFYSGGSPGEFYTVHAATTNDAFRIDDNTVANGQSISSNTIFAYDVITPIQQQFKSDKGTSSLVASNGNANLQVALTSLGDGRIYSVETPLQATAFNSPYLVSSSVMIDTQNSAALTQSVNIVNAGSTPTTALSAANFSVSGNFIISDSSSCNVSIMPNGSCSIVLTFIQGSKGSGSVTVSNYGGSSSLNIPVSWDNGAGGGPQLSVYVSPFTPFNATSSESQTVEISNPMNSGYDVTNVQLTANPATVPGTANVQVGSLTCVNSTGQPQVTGVLPQGGNCSAPVTVSDNAYESIPVNIVLNVTATVTATSSTYSRAASFSYTTLEYLSNLIMSVATPMTIMGNNVQTTQESIVVINTGTAPATIDSAILSNNTSLSSWFFESSNSCVNGKILNYNESCVVVSQLGPVIYSNINSPQTPSGSESLTINYTGTGQTPHSMFVTESIAYNVTPNTTTLIFSQVTPTGSSAGTGAGGTPIVFNGSSFSVGGQKVAITVKNVGPNTTQITGINNAYNPLYWSVVDGCTGQQLQANQTCNYVYTNTLGNVASYLSGLTSSVNTSISSPIFIFLDQQTSMYESVSPTFPVANGGGLTLNIVESMAYISNSLITATNQVIVSQQIANAGGYSNFSLGESIESYFSGSPTKVEAGTSGSAFTCTGSASAATQIWTENCAVNVTGLTNGNGTVTLTYPVVPWIASLGESISVVYSLTPANSVIGFNSLYQTATTK